MGSEDFQSVQIDGATQRIIGIHKFANSQRDVLTDLENDGLMHSEGLRPHRRPL